MAMKKTLIEGTSRYEYDYDGHPDGGLMLTGPIATTITLKDGTVYDVTPEVIEHAPGHAGPILHHIEKFHEEMGGIPVGPNSIRTPFTHVCTDACGMEKDLRREGQLP